MSICVRNLIQTVGLNKSKNIMSLDSTISFPKLNIQISRKGSALKAFHPIL